MIERWMVRTLLPLTCCLLLTGLPSVSKAQEVQVKGPLAGAPAVRHMRIYRAKRLQLQPFVGFTLQDQFSRTILFGGQLNYHFTDWLAFGVWGGYGGVHINTGLTNEVNDLGQTTDRNALSLPSRENFENQIAQMMWAAAAQVTFIPLRGKLSLFQKLFVDTDFYLFGGVAAVGVEERADVNTEGAPVCQTAPSPNATNDDPCVATQLARQSRVSIAPTFGVGLMMHITSWIGVSIEWRGLPFKWNTSGTDERGAGPGRNFPDGQISSADRRFLFNHMINLGVAFTLPPKARLSD